MKVLVTGANGYIGHHVIQSLLKYNVSITALVRNKANTINFDSRISIFELDIFNFEDNVFEQLGTPDVVIHLAWGYLSNFKSARHLENELPAHYKFLKHLIDSGLNSLLVVGTCLEYGMQFGPMTENLKAAPIIPYAHAKNELRLKLESLQSSQKYNLTWARLFYIYGDDSGNETLYSQLKRAVLKGESHFNMSGGNQLRDYLPVYEVSRQLASLAVNECPIRLLNICSGTPISVRELVEYFLRENSWDINLNLGYYSYNDYEPMAFWGVRHSQIDSLVI